MQVGNVLTDPVARELQLLQVGMMRHGVQKLLPAHCRKHKHVMKLGKLIFASYKDKSEKMPRQV